MEIDIEKIQPLIALIGALFFGAVVGWMAHHVFKQTKEVSVQWLGTMISVIAGGAVTAVFDRQGHLFGSYCIGLGSLFFLRVVFSPITNAVSKEIQRLQEQQTLEDLKRESNGQSPEATL